MTISINLETTCKIASLIIFFISLGLLLYYILRKKCPKCINCQENDTNCIDCKKNKNWIIFWIIFTFISLILTILAFRYKNKIIEKFKNTKTQKKVSISEKDITTIKQPTFILQQPTQSQPTLILQQPTQPQPSKPAQPQPSKPAQPQPSKPAQPQPAPQPPKTAQQLTQPPKTPQPAQQLTQPPQPAQQLTQLSKTQPSPAPQPSKPTQPSPAPQPPKTPQPAQLTQPSKTQPSPAQLTQPSKTQPSPAPQPSPKTPTQQLTQPSPKTSTQKIPTYTTSSNDSDNSPPETPVRTDYLYILNNNIRKGSSGSSVSASSTQSPSSSTQSPSSPTQSPSSPTQSPSSPTQSPKTQSPSSSTLVGSISENRSSVTTNKTEFGSDLQRIIRLAELHRDGETFDSLCEADKAWLTACISDNDKCSDELPVYSNKNDNNGCNINDIISGVKNEVKLKVSLATKCKNNRNQSKCDTIIQN